MLEKMSVQQDGFKVTPIIFVSVGLGVWRDVWEVEEFYSLISGTRAVLENRCVDPRM